MKAGELLRVVLRDRGNDAAEPAERLIAVARNRPPEMLASFREADPAPLVEVAVPVSDQDVDEARAQVVAGIDLLVRALLQPDEQVQRIRNLVGAFHVVFDPLFEQSQHACKRLAELTEGRIVGHDCELRCGVEDAGRLEQRCDHQRGDGMDGAGEVLDDVPQDRSSRLRIEQSGRVLVDGAKHPGAFVAALQMNVGRLEAAAAPLGPQPPVECLEIQNGDIDRRGPQVAPLLAQNQA